MSLYSNCEIGDEIRISNQTSSSYYTMLVVEKKLPNEVWLLSVDNFKSCNWAMAVTLGKSAKQYFTTSVQSNITESRLLKKEEIDGNSKLTYFRTLQYRKNLNGDWWTDSEYPTNNTGAYGLHLYGLNFSVNQYTKTNEFETHPLIILNGAKDISGITFSPKLIPIPTISPTSFTYDGSTYSPTISGFDSSTMSQGGTSSASAVGSYTITFSLKDTTKYNWSNNPAGATAAVKYTWTITAPALTTISVPTPNKTLTYNGSEQTMTFSNSSYCTIMGNTGTNAGTYYATVTPKSGYCWSDGSTAGKTVSWTINKKSLPIPSQKGTLTYNGNSQSPQWNNYNSMELSIGGTLSGIDAKTYTARFTPTSNYCWSDGSTSARNVNWSIGRLGLNPPKQSGTLIYNGKPQSPTWNTDYNSSFMLFDKISEIDANTYYVTFKCNSSCYFYEHNYGDDTSTTVSWVINRSPTAVPPVMSDNSFQYDGNQHSPLWVLFDTELVEVISGGYGTNASVYTAVVCPTSNYCWEDGSINGIPYKWKITRKPLSYDPTYRGTLTLEYNGEEQSPEWVNYPQNFVSATVLSAISAGNYTAVFSVDSNHCWVDKTYAPIKIKWNIARKRIVKPSYTNKLVYNGSEQHPNWRNYDKNELDISGDLSGVHAGEYTTIFTPTDNYQWTDGNYEPFSIDWEIDKYHFIYPFQAENRDPENPRMYYPNKSEYLVYNGMIQFPTLWFGNIYNKNLVTGIVYGTFTVEKNASAVNVGDYVMRLTPDTDHCWADGNSEPYDVPWRIVKQKLVNPSQNAKGLTIPSPRGEQYYTGEVIYPEFDNYNPNILEISGETSGIDVGSYTVYFEIKDKENYEWASGQNGKVPVVWRIINPLKLVDYPYQGNYLVYNGKYQSPEWKNYNSNAMILVGGTPQEINIGEYPAEFQLRNGYAWFDGKTDNAVVKWSIDKVSVVRPFVRGTDREGCGGQYIEVDGKHYPVWENYNPDVMTMSGDTYATDSLIHTTIFTLKNPSIYEWNSGTGEPIEVRWRLDVPYEPGTGGGNWIPGGGGVPSIPDYPVNIPGVIDIDPSDIPPSITDGDYRDKWHIGDKFPIELNGIVGGVEFKNAWFYVYIIGFDHNSKIEGNKTIHFQFAKMTDNGQEIAFIDKYYGVFSDDQGFCMNKTETTNGGWKDSYMRTVCKQFYNALPESWRNIIIPCPKYTDNVGGGTNSPDSVTMTKDKIFLLSEYECIGRNVSSNFAEDNYQEQYEYYKRNGFKGKGKYNSPDENVDCWLRSPFHSSESEFCSVFYSPTNPNGGCAGRSATASLGFAPCFAVGETGSAGTGGGYDPDDPNHNNPTPGSGGVGVKRVHIPRQIKPPYEDGTTKVPKWDEYDDYAIVNLGGEWNGISANTYHVILRLNPGYIWEDGTTEIKTVPWKILTVGESAPPSPNPIRVHIPQQINPPYFDRYYKTPEWDEWNRFAINVIGGVPKAVVADKYRLFVELLPGYIWEDGTKGNKILPWVILPVGAKLPDDNPDKPEIIEQDKPKPDNLNGNDSEDNIPGDSNGNCCCCCCDTGLFDMLNNACPDDGLECDCTKEVEI